MTTSTRDWSKYHLCLMYPQDNRTISRDEFVEQIPPDCTLDEACKRLNRINREMQLFFVSREHFVRAGFSSFRRTFLAIQRKDGRPMGWEELQKVKNEIAGTDRWAHQLFPPTSEEVNVSNCYHLMVYNRTERPLGCLPQRPLEDQALSIQLRDPDAPKLDITLSHGAAWRCGSTSAATTEEEIAP